MTRKILIALMVGGVLFAGRPSRAAAFPEQAADRACFGAFASTFAQANEKSGQLVSWAAQAPGPFGETVSNLAQCQPPAP